MDIHLPWWVGLCASMLTFAAFLRMLVGIAVAVARAQALAGAEKRCSMLGCKGESCGLCVVHAEDVCRQRYQSSAPRAEVRG
jgi:hypothetical protein